MIRATVYFRDREAGELARLDDGSFRFAYRPDYLAEAQSLPISLTLPLQLEPYASPSLFPFFHGLLAEGSIKELQCRQLKIDPDDDFTRLLKTAHSDTIGAVTVRECLTGSDADA
ncbi:MAG: HipA N-terminal domain-containing protein [Verrucomicrobiales bacterium]